MFLTDCECQVGHKSDRRSPIISVCTYLRTAVEPKQLNDTCRRPVIFLVELKIGLRAKSFWNDDPTLARSCNSDGFGSSDFEKEEAANLKVNIFFHFAKKLEHILQCTDYMHIDDTQLHLFVHTMYI